MILGIDYASVDGNKPPDFTAAKAAGLRFAFVRASYEKWPDVTCSRDRASIRDAGLIYGAYMFPVLGPGHPSPEEQVATFASGAGLIARRDFAPVIDVEFPAGGIARTGVSRSDISVWLGRARAAIVRRFGTEPIVYSSARVLDGNDADGLNGAVNSALGGLPLWLARYPFKTRIDAVIEPARVDALPPPPSPAAWGPNAAWIHQDQGDALHFPGFTSTVDCDRYLGLAHGAHGSRVQWLQERVGADADGDFGPLTEMRLQRYQASVGLADTGSADVATFAALSWALA